MRILSLDLSLSSTGYVVIIDGKIKECNRIVSESKDVNLKSKKLKDYYYYHSNSDEDKRLYQLIIVLEYLIKHYQITDVVIENQYVGCNPKVGLLLARIKGATTYIAKLWNCNIHSITPTEVRKIVMNKGKVGKDEIAEYIRNNYYDCGEFSDKTGKNKTSDMYDAIALGVAFCKLNNIEVE